MRPAAEGLKRILSEIEIRPFSVGVITNVEAELNLEQGRVKSLLADQAVRPVRWEETVRKLDALGCRRGLEIGPGKVLKGLIKRIVPQLAVDNFETPEDLTRVKAG